LGGLKQRGKKKNKAGFFGSECKKTAEKPKKGGD